MRIVFRFLPALAVTFFLSGATDVPVPASCTPDVNAKMAQLLARHQKRQVDNVMVCGVATANSTTQPGGPHGDHELIAVQAKFPDGSEKLIQVVTNDALDGKVTAEANASVMAFGQAFFDRTGKYAAGVHEVHCSTHLGADNGWIVVNGVKYPNTACIGDSQIGRKRWRHRS